MPMENLELAVKAAEKTIVKQVLAKWQASGRKKVMKMSSQECRSRAVDYRQKLEISRIEKLNPPQVIVDYWKSCMDAWDKVADLKDSGVLPNRLGA